ncbi:very low-density lipoprotein receptor-like [Pecten maximus]|uniref:very low-density lipoprotein receptor-like n=1 Tax=Pecten maximus TaxID=6579 RepID=UPI001458C4F9|nr:very low-density lipoprotein receptor-like [Pecten maximus]
MTSTTDGAMSSSRGCIDYNSTCDTLVASIDICNDTESAYKFCRKTCGMCREISTEAMTSSTYPFNPVDTCRGFQCGTGHCLPLTFHCDGQVDCSDGSDEDTCDHNGCKQDEFQCGTGSCIPTQWRCDSVEDCIDGSDEKACTSNIKTIQPLIDVKTTETTTTSSTISTTPLPVMTSLSTVEMTSPSGCLDLNSTCDTLMSSIDICNDTESALTMCQKSCGLCGVTSTDINMSLPHSTKGK